MLVEWTTQFTIILSFFTTVYSPLFHTQYANTYPNRSQAHSDSSFLPIHPRNFRRPCSPALSPRSTEETTPLMRQTNAQPALLVLLGSRLGG